MLGHVLEGRGVRRDGGQLKEPRIPVLHHSRTSGEDQTMDTYVDTYVARGRGGGRSSTACDRMCARMYESVHVHARVRSPPTPLPRPHGHVCLCAGPYVRKLPSLEPAPSPCRGTSRAQAANQLSSKPGREVGMAPRHGSRLGRGPRIEPLREVWPGLLARELSLIHI